MSDAKFADNEWFVEMERVYALLPDYTGAYVCLGRLFIRIIGEYTADSDILLVGSFAKTDYLLKKKEADSELKRYVNDMRLRLTRKTEAQTAVSFLTDFRTLCFFISLLADVPVPTILASKFPEVSVNEHYVWRSEEYLRVVVSSWDDEFIYCTGDVQGEDICVRYSSDVQSGLNDHSYLADVLHKDVMLNLIHPCVAEDGTFVPEFIIYEPDFLVDVSTVVSCFDTYADSPLLALLKRLEPYEVTEPIVLGNMASELLDEVLHEKSVTESHSSQLSPETVATQLREAYKQTAMKFFRRNAVAMLSIETSGDFHSNAWRQFMNIRRALLHMLPGQVGRYDRDNVIVEPTFFSEMLGLQGRMDMLQTDMRVLVEQKSGKAGFRPGYNDADTPIYTERHYMQMLLYMAIIRYNFRQVYDANRHELYACLLYSRYTHPLVSLGFAPRLLFDALRMRNLYVAQEEQMSKGGIATIMEMVADDFNRKSVAGKFWECYQRPRIERLLKPFHAASPLERAYFERFYGFVALEHRLAKMGNQTKENAGFACAWLSSTDEKLQAGDILLDLNLLPPVSDLGYIEFVTLQYDGESGNFRRGDIVVLYSYAKGQEPDMRRTMLFRATIIGIEYAEITVQLRNAQRDVTVFRGGGDRRWCLEHDFMESSYSGLYKGLYAFLLAPRERRDLLLMQRQPEISRQASLLGEYGVFNELQQKIKNASDLFLVIGPPGTGKTSFGMLNTLQEELREDGSKVLIVSYTNRSVDEICSKLYPHIHFIRIGGEASSSQVYRKNMLATMVSECTSVAELRNRITSARVLVGTISAVSANLSVIGRSRFSLCIVDEASQVLEPYLLPLLSLSHDGVVCIRKFVMIGDHKQLSAVVQQKKKESIVEDKSLNDIELTDCRNSLFERLLRRYSSNPDVCYMLTRQGRMHRDIARFPNVAFYGGLLKEVPLTHQLSETAVTSRVRFIDVLPYPDSPSDKVNMAEAEVIVAELWGIWEATKEAFVPTETVGVIVPYRNQISAIRTLLVERVQDMAHPLLQITIDTVERYQGSQRNYIIYAFTVQRQYQLRFLTETTFVEDGMMIDRKLNVAMTRALEYLILVGNASLIGKWPLYHNLLRYIADGTLPVEVKE